MGVYDISSDGYFSTAFCNTKMVIKMPYNSASSQLYAVNMYQKVASAPQFENLSGVGTSGTSGTGGTTLLTGGSYTWIG